MGVQIPYPHNVYVDLLNNGCRLEDLFAFMGWRNVALYGAGDLGRFFYEALKSTDVTVKCVIDNNKRVKFPYPGVPVITPDRIVEYDGDVDVIIACLYRYNQAYGIMRQHTRRKMITIFSLLPEFEPQETIACVFSEFKRVENLCKENSVGLYVLVGDNYLAIENRSLREKTLHENRTIETSALLNIYSFLEMFKELYADVAPTSIIEYVEEVSRQPGIIEIDGRLYNPDIQSKYMNVANHMRHTTDQPAEFANTIHIYGPCWTFGVGVEDKFTVASHLQRLLNASHGDRYRVLNRSVWGGTFDMKLRNVRAIDFHPGDICVLFLSYALPWLRYIADGETIFADCTDAYERPHDQGEIFIDCAHVNHRGTYLLAKRMHRQLFEVRSDAGGTQANDRRKPPKIECRTMKGKGGDEGLGAGIPDFDRQITDYLDYLEKMRFDREGVSGAIVMNCNPFTLGHRYLIERAAAQAGGGGLYIFCLEEEGPGFPFRERIEMLAAGTADLENVRVLRSGKLIISKQTLPEYFSKDGRKNSVVLSPMDALIFAKHIAPALSISVRFSGDEPTCVVTRAYVKQLAEILPAHGVEFKIIPRVEHDGKAISASRVRELLRQGDFEGIRPLVPASTFEFLTENYREEGQA